MTTTDVHPLDLPASLKRAEAQPPVNAAPKPAAKPKAKPAVNGKVQSKAKSAENDDAHVVTLKALCAELKIDPYAARVARSKFAGQGRHDCAGWT